MILWKIENELEWIIHNLQKKIFQNNLKQLY